jgi:hypothetical protein
MFLDRLFLIVHTNILRIGGQPVREQDRKKFVLLANKRVNNAIKSMQLVGNLSNKSNYDYTEKDVEKIFLALQNELRACRRRFDSSGKKNGTIFSLN